MLKKKPQHGTSESGHPWTRSPLGKDFWLSVHRPGNARFAPMVIEVGSDVRDMTMLKVGNHAEKLAHYLESKGYVRSSGVVDRDRVDILSVGSVIGVTEACAEAVAQWLSTGCDIPAVGPSRMAPAGRWWDTKHRD